MPALPRCPTRPSVAPLLLALLAAAGPAVAQYKVVEPDGSVTYTDRPPAGTGAKVTPLGRGGAAAAPAVEATLPAELRQPVARYPVVLYTGNDCTPCDTARQWLQQRGVPYRERRVATEDDAQALERLVGARSVPALTVGAQPVRGFAELDWAAYLDAAGYPRESRLPRGWQPPPVLPLVAARTPAAASPAPPSAPQAAPEVPPAAPGAIRF
jgi:glutaredoxin